VTLLAWADYLDAAPTPLNRYFEAKAAGELDRVEAARRRIITITPYRSGLVFTTLLLLTAVTVVVVEVAHGPRHLIWPYGGWTALLVVGIPVIAFLGYIGICTLFEDRLPGNWKDFTTTRNSNDPCGHISLYIINKRTKNVPALIMGSLGLASFALLVIALAVAPLPLVSWSLIAYLAVAVVVGILNFIPFSDGFSQGNRFYLYRPSPYIDVYDDPRSQHWIIAGSQSTSTLAAFVAEPVLPAA
jgi:hypothetical protein